MISISCEHPDLVDFINLKTDLDICTKANISVRVTDAFMDAVVNNLDFKLHFTLEDGSSVEKIVNAREIFTLLAKRNWEMAEPGVLYWDRIKTYNLLQNTDFQYVGVNPCAEEPLPAGGSCLLGSINLSEFVIDPYTPLARIDYDLLEEAVVIAVMGLNDVLLEGLPLHPLKEQRDSVYDWRQIGLGTMGLADTLIKLGIKYDSDTAIGVIETIYHTIAEVAVETSLELAEVHGCFPRCTDEIKEKIACSDFIRNLHLSENLVSNIRKYGLYNSQLLTCAPTGSISTMFQVSGGVEPNYAFSYNRRTVSLNEQETVYKVDTKIVQDYKKLYPAEPLPDYFVASHDIDPFKRIDVQAALQKYIDASISSTINLKEETTVEQVVGLYVNAWRKGLKGMTIWRDNCQRQAILSTDKPSDKDSGTSVSHTPVRKVSDDCIGRKRTLMTGCGTLHLTAFFDRNTGQLLETYFSKGSQGGCALFMVGLSRMVSLAARANVSIEAIVDQLKSSGTCPSYAVRTATKHDTSKGSCCPVAIGYALMDMYNEIQRDLETVVKLPEGIQLPSPHEGPVCPKCGEHIVMTEGCMTCPSCGYSKCN